MTELSDGRTARIRPVVFKDSEALQAVEAAIVRAGVGVVMGPEDIRDVRTVMDRVGAILDAGDLLYVAELDGEIVGSIDVKRIPVKALAHNAELTMGLVPGAQGLGLGRALLHKALLWARNQGIERIELACLADNPGALGLYEAAGFERIHVRRDFLRWPDGRTVDDVMMERRLDSPLVLTRPERHADREAVHTIHSTAFSTPDEAAMVDAVRPDAVHSRVALCDGEVVAHALFSAMRHEPDPGQPTGRVIGLAPLAVRPDRQRNGLGSQLMRDALAHLARSGPCTVVLLGDPAYYQRFGFTPCTSRGLRWRPLDHPEAFMALDLGESAVGPGVLRYHEHIEAL